MKTDKEKVDLESMHESDLTKKQKRQLEWQRVKVMTWRERLDFFWDYYKWVLLVILVAAFVVLEGIGAFHRMQQTTLLSLAVMDAALGSQEDVDRLCTDLALVIGTGDEMEVVTIDTAVMSGDTVAATSKLMVVVAAGMTDVMFIDEATYQKLSEQEAFLDWRDVLGADYDTCSSAFDSEGRLELSHNEKWKSYGLTMYEPVYCAVLESSERLEAAAKLAEYFAGALNPEASEA